MNKFTVIVPIAGKGSRFADQGWATPKPKLVIRGQTMLQYALSCLPKDLIQNVIFVDRLVEPTMDDYRSAQDMLPRDWDISRISACVVREPAQTGQGTSVLYGLQVSREDNPIIVMNCDQVLTCSLAMRRSLADVLTGKSRGWIATFVETKGEYDKWSYVVPKYEYKHNAMLPTHVVDGTVEKPCHDIGGEAIVGLFAFLERHALQTAIEQDVYYGTARCNNEHYLAPAINRYIAAVDSSAAQDQVYWGPVVAEGIGTPEDLDRHDITWRVHNK